MKLVLFDDRNDSSSQGEYQEIILSPKNYSLVTIPPLFGMVSKFR